MSSKKIFVSTILLALAMTNAKAEIISVDSGTNIEGEIITIKGKNLHSVNNPAQIGVANENNELYGALEIISAKPNKIVAKLPYVSALRYLILHVSGGTTSGNNAELIPLIVFNSPAVLDSQDGDIGQAITSGTVSFTGPAGAQGDKGDKGDTGAQGQAGVAGTSILTTNNAFSGANTFSGAATLSGTTILAGTTTLSGNTTLSGRIQGTSPVVFEGSTGSANGTTLSITGPTAARTITIPDTSGTMVVRDTSKSIGIVTGGTAWAIYPETGAYDVMTVNVDAAGRTITTITNGVAGHVLMMNFSFTSGADVTITDTDAGAVNTIDLVGTATNAAIDTNGDTLILMNNGSRWIEIGRTITP